MINLHTGQLCIRRELKNGKVQRISQLQFVGEFEGKLLFDEFDDSGKPISVKYWVSSINYPTNNWTDYNGDSFKVIIDAL